MRWKCCGREANADDLFCPDCTDEDGVYDDDDAIEGYDFDDDAGGDDDDDDYADESEFSAQSAAVVPRIGMETDA